MDLIKFRVTMYKGIIDSGWVDVDRLTVLVGKNESGKTSLLKALHKLNPYNDEPYQMNREWPRARRRGRDEQQVVCRAEFQLSDSEKSDLTQITGQAKIPDTVEVSRNYTGNIRINGHQDLLSDKLSPNDIDNVFDYLPEVEDELSDQFKHTAEECLKELRGLAEEGQTAELAELVHTHEQSLRESVSESDPPQRIESQFIDQYISEFNSVVEQLEELYPIRSKVHDYLITHLPTFIYMDDYRAFTGTAQLNEIQARRAGDRLEEEDKTFLTILNLSGLDLDGLIQLGQEGEDAREERQYDLDDGAGTLTSEFAERLRQRRYEVDFRVDDQQFFTFVKDDQDKALIRLEERSKGFQWFFSFDLMLMHESEGTFKGCVILLDEPGLHLHPEAQKDLLRRLEHYADGNTLLYTTHLPFMIDLKYPDRIRVLKETDNGIVVTTDLTESPPEAKFVLQAALGMDASQSFLVANRNLVVEGVDDYWVLTELSNLLRQGGAEGLPDDVLITPGGGASAAVHIATIMTGQKLDVVVLFDSDKAGEDAKDKLVKKWITRYSESQAEVILLGDAVEIDGDFALEDLFPEQFIVDIVKDAYGKQLAIAEVDEIEPRGEGILWKRIERFMNEKGIQINKGPIATRLRKKLSSMENVSKLPEGTQDKAIKLFDKIRSAFHEGDTQSS
jgi:predicted ATP-dependent endonuclease of OLD family